MPVEPGAAAGVAQDAMRRVEAEFPADAHDAMLSTQVATVQLGEAPGFIVDEANLPTENGATRCRVATSSCANGSYSSSSRY
jgi:hypothetical protein